MSLEKYRNLYELAKEVHREELRRSDLVQQQAARYFTAVTFLFGAGAVLAKGVADAVLPPRSGAGWFPVVAGVVAFFALLVAWIQIFRTYGAGQLSKVPLTPEMIEFFRTNREVDVYFALSKRIADGHAGNRKRNDAKVDLLTGAGRAIQIAAVSLGILLGCYVGFTWNAQRETTTLEGGGVTMQDEEKPAEDTSQEATDSGQEETPAEPDDSGAEPNEETPAQPDDSAAEPDPDVEAPEMELVKFEREPGDVHVVDTEPAEAEPPDATGDAGEDD